MNRPEPSSRASTVVPWRGQDLTVYAVPRTEGEMLDRLRDAMQTLARLPLEAGDLPRVSLSMKLPAVRGAWDYPTETRAPRVMPGQREVDRLRETLEWTFGLGPATRQILQAYATGMSARRIADVARIGSHVTVMKYVRRGLAHCLERAALQNDQNRAA